MTLLLSVKGTETSKGEQSFEEWWESYLESLYTDTIPVDSIIDTSKVIDEKDIEITKEEDKIDIMRGVFKSGIQIAVIFVFLVATLVFIRRRFRF